MDQENVLNDSLQSTTKPFIGIEPNLSSYGFHANECVVIGYSFDVIVADKFVLFCKW